MNGFSQFPRINAELEALVVDDQAEVLRVLDIGLRPHGFRVRLASSGHEAVEIFRRHRSTVDVVLSDVQMPGLDGPQTLVEIRALAPAIPVLFMTADSGEYSTQDLLAMSGCDVLTKPFQSLAHVARHLRAAVLRQPVELHSYIAWATFGLVVAPAPATPSTPNPRSPAGAGSRQTGRPGNR